MKHDLKVEGVGFELCLNNLLGDNLLATNEDLDHLNVGAISSNFKVNLMPQSLNHRGQWV